MKRFAIGLSLVLAAGIVLGADFWVAKKPSEWSQKEAEKILHNSPWTRVVTLEMAGGMMGGGGGRGGGRRGGGGGGGGGGFGGGGAGGDIAGGGGAGIGGGGGTQGATMGDIRPPAETATIIWESALPVHEAKARLEMPDPLKEVSAEYYVVSLSPFKMMMRGEPDEIKKRILGATSLQLKDKEPIPADDIKVMRGEKGATLLFFFKRSGAISEADKEVTFQSRLGPSQVKTKFNLKKMMVGGKLAL